MVDCSHANANKQHKLQMEVSQDIAQQLASGSEHVFGVMIESHLIGGAQKFTPGRDSVQALSYGQSITDACLSWEDSLSCLQTLSDAVLQRRRNKGH
jgi:3-deoxy-7-phosphoheptulonate synthase